MKFRVGVEGFTLDSAHYTLSSPADSQIHGHTYQVNVEVEGEVEESTGFVVNFEEVRRVLTETLREWDHKLIVPARDVEKLELRGPFRVEIKVIDAPFPTAEFIAAELARELHSKLGSPKSVRVRIYEGKEQYVTVEYP
ncbi:6-pyruvoyl tetrahydrobiopterin synthase [Sulfodiicoccus acidiphilus]|uniref:6-pyruvoyl tetrahydrobiopterin synthase n=1 Tax=Sulfodiicoccus acidiphilus TaxID=1670455 RepID=A0A348B487_9CREN|nr:6-carboxytetrahydropterin synthase [Sulfodiicoccus acidiphilus]BBD72989.1 6-pyruvoyl tetrahydrobiopterin synthase [Sulfodiicoccus acidiphilus]GGT87525.1 6-pyruvoyl tetrahydrobiopterin synthase [Sulfodiicoccus acidiphilus]